MKKDFAKKTGAVKRSPKKNNFPVVVFGLVLLLAFGGGVMYYRHVRSFQGSQLASTYVSNFKNWLAEHHKHLHPTPSKVKHLASTKDDGEEPPVHFEFYTALSNAHVSVPEPVEPDEKKSVAAKPSGKSLLAEKKSLAVADAKSLEEELAEAARTK